MLDVPVIDAHAVALAALDGLSDGVLVVADGSVLVANEAAHRLTGRDPGTLTGGDAPAWVATAAAHGGALDVALPCRDGRRRRVTVGVAPCPLPGGGVAQLVTVRDRSAEAAREAELVRQAHPRRPHRPAQPALVHRAAGRGGRAAVRPRPAARAGRRRPRPLQGRQRRVRPPGR
jgi:PAS domain-containing protein